MKIDDYSKTELLEEHQRCIEKIAKLSDKCGEIKRSIAILESMELEASLIAAEQEHVIHGPCSQ